MAVVGDGVEVESLSAIFDEGLDLLRARFEVDGNRWAPVAQRIGDCFPEGGDEGEFSRPGFHVGDGNDFNGYAEFAFEGANALAHCFGK